MYSKAIVRKPGENFSEGLTTVNLGTPDFSIVQRQHSAYIKILSDLGLHVEVLDPVLEHPDAHFVEDVAVIFSEAAIVTNPGAEARKGEVDFIKPVLKKYKDLKQINPPGTLDGGDVLQIGKQFFVGISARTNKDGAQQFREITKTFGYSVQFIEVGDGLHLKSSVNYVGNETVLITSDLKDHDAFKALQKIIIDDDEAYAANSLWINNNVLTPAGFPKTRACLESLNLNIIELHMSEVQKMDGGLTCLSLRF